ncbi:MAG: indolepyruvate oxidoreductase subunit beta [Dehalococcoidales bacterium]|nr:indolepyruvate oxidoreductase subunit beta [Dehalococcoidales bacterium]
MQNINIIMTGIGGQGIILASDILAETAMRMDFDVKKTDSIGMAQRGGSVISHIRMGEEIFSPVISEGMADILVGMEKLEAARSCHLLKQGGKAIINRYSAPPLSVGSSGGKYPEDDIILDLIKGPAEEIFFIDGSAKTLEIGNIRTLNVFLLGALSTLLPFKTDIWQEVLEAKLPAKILEINMKAFSLGQKEIESARIS